MFLNCLERASGAGVLQFAALLPAEDEPRGPVPHIAAAIARRAAPLPPLLLGQPETIQSKQKRETTK